ncbi:MAG: DHH family phosphoesterase [Chitinispirillia bacterium]|jgi:phosphoesterase RecJ-like protein
MIFSKLHSIINENNSFMLSSHMNSDGDCICALLTLYWYIRSLGKKVTIFHIDQVPSKFNFLLNADKIGDKRSRNDFDVFIIVDSSNPGRLGWDTEKINAPIHVNIDHHRDNSQFGHLNLIDCKASATCQILYYFLNEFSVKYPSYIAETLYTGILCDTGGFQFSNTNSTVLSVCADLAEKGADCHKIYRNIFTSVSKEGLILRNKIWSTLEFYLDDRISSIELSSAEFDQSGADRGDIEGMSDKALSIKGVDVGIFIKYSENSTHFSLRSKGTVDVGIIAQKVVGGGGHTSAAGCTIDLPVDRAKVKMVEIIKKEIE